MTNIHNLTSNVLIKPSLSPKTRTGATNGTGVDTLGYDRACVVFSLGVHDRDDADETFTGTVEGSNDNSSFTPITGATTGAIGAVVPNATTGTTYEVEVNLAKAGYRYIRAVGTPAGTTPSDAYGAVVLLFNARYKAPTQDNTPVLV